MDPTLIQLLLPYLGGMTNSDASSTLGVQSKSTNNIQDILSLLLSSQFGVMSNTYDPMLTVNQPQPVSMTLPITDQYANSGIPILQEVALGLKSGQYVPEQAQNMLKQAINDGTLSGWDPKQTDATVMSMFNEIAAKRAETDKAAVDAQGPPNNIYSQAGLPQPTETYSAGFDQNGQFSTNAPIDPTLGKQMGDSTMALHGANDYLSRYQQQNPNYRDAAGRSSAASDVSTLTAASQRAAASAHDKTTIHMPTSADEARAMAERLGVDPGTVQGWYEQSWKQTVGDKHKRVSVTQGLSPTEKAAFEAQFKRLVDFSAKNGGTAQNAAFAWTKAQGKQVKPSKADVKKAETAAAWSGRGAEYASRLSSQKVSSSTKSFESQQAKSAASLREAQMRQMANADFMTAQGQTPLGDTLQQRVALLRAAGLL